MAEDVKIPIEVSARHVHLSEEHIEILFGKGYKLTNKAELSQKGFYVANEKVEVVGKKSSANFGILLPTRSRSQVELAITDSIKLGIEPIIRNSGDLGGSASCILRGPQGEIELEQGVIVAARHVHISPENAEKLDVKHDEYMSVKVGGKRPLIFENVLVRVDPSFGCSMHIDTDEGNAANINNKNQTFGTKF